MKKRICIRLDEDVLEWFKSQGKGYQAKMNEALRNYMDGIVERIGLPDEPRFLASPKPASFFKPMPKGGKKKKK